MIALTPRRTLPPATRTLVCVIVGVGLLEQLMGGSPAHWILWREAPRASAVLTSAVIHASAPHLIDNVLLLATLGGLVERRVGSLSALVLMLWAALGSATGYLLFDPCSGLGGSSGVGYGLLGASMVLCRGQRVRVVASWPLALACLALACGGSAQAARFVELAALLCFVLPAHAGRLLLRARLRVHWLTLPLAAQAIHHEGFVAGAHWGGFLAGAAVAGALLLGRRVRPRVVSTALPPRRAGIDSPPGQLQPTPSCSGKDPL